MPHASFQRVVVALVLSACASQDKIQTLERQNKKFQSEVTRLRADLNKLNEARAKALQEAEKTRADREPPEGYPDVGAWGSPIVPPPYVGFTERPPVGWGEAGNEGRSVRLANDWNPRYYFRIFLDNEEVVFTDGVGVWRSIIQTRRGIRQVSLLRPKGEAKLRVSHGEHHLLVEHYSCDEFDCEFTGEVCEWQVDFNRFRGPWHFFGGECHKASPSN